MTAFDMTPLFRTSVGFDRLSRLMESAMRAEGNEKGYPPYNIVRNDENLYTITLAVAGFAEADLEIVAQENTLTVKGRSAPDPEGTEYLHRGIAGRAFERRFQLADHITVCGARLEHGLLHVSLEREVPEKLKPRTIAIETLNGKTLEASPS